jgi:hypothetical protein
MAKTFRLKWITVLIGAWFFVLDAQLAAWARFFAS